MKMKLVKHETITTFDGAGHFMVWEPDNTPDATYTIRVIKINDDSFAACWDVPTAMMGYGETEEAAFYDLLECTAEWGLDDKGRDYPPSWHQQLRWRIDDLVHGILRRFGL